MLERKVGQYEVDETNFVRQLLEEWGACNDEYVSAARQFMQNSKNRKPDIIRNFRYGYWYNKRANVGLLAAAAWKSGFTALEEFSVDRKNAGCSRNGRCDLKLFDGQIMIDIEAKIIWPASADIAKRVTDCLKKASDQIETLGDQKELAFEACFVVPYISTWYRNKERDEGACEAIRNDIWDSVREYVSAENEKIKEGLAYAIYTPSASFDELQDPDSNACLYYPGVGLILKRH